MSTPNTGVAEEVEAGRETDARVSELVMGQPVVGEAPEPAKDDFGFLPWLLGDKHRVMGTCVCEVLAKDHAEVLALYEADASPFLMDACRARWDANQWLGHHLMCFKALPRYSTDISAAWLVVEKLRERRIYLTVEACWDLYEAKDFVARVLAQADTAPLAICRAALAATTPQPEQQISTPTPPRNP